MKNGKFRVLLLEEDGRASRPAEPLAAFDLPSAGSRNEACAAFHQLQDILSAAPLDGVLAASPQMTRVLHMVEKLASSDVGLVLFGERGTGKKTLAQAIHRLSPRATAPFVTVGCATLPAMFLEDELFGRGAAADGHVVRPMDGKVDVAACGTLFLDDIGDLPPPLQAKLFAFLQGHAELRVICASDQDLDKLMAAGQFREDLYYRLNEVRLVIPPLREREGDAVLLAHRFLHRFAAQFDRKIDRFTADALAAIALHPWPGNVRELEIRVKRAVVMAEGREITAVDLELAPAVLAAGSLDLREVRARAERIVVQRALSQTHGNLSRAAKLLGISRPTLYSLLDDLGIDAVS